MIKAKHVLSIFFTALLVLGIGNGAAKEVGFDIIHEGNSLEGYQLKLEICNLDHSNMTSSCSQTIDLANVGKETSKFFPLDAKLNDSLPGKLNVSLLDSEMTVVEEDYVLLKSLNQLQGLQVTLDGLTKKVSVSTLEDRLGMALLSAPQS